MSIQRSGPYAAGPPPEALVVHAPPLGRLRPADPLRLAQAGAVLALALLRAMVVWVVGMAAAWLVPRPRRRLAEAVAGGLVDAFEVLGPTYVKLGQLVASSPGVFPTPLADAARRCLAEVPPIPASAARAVIEGDLGAPVDRLFRSFDDRPLASASIAQVHACVLPDGREAVVKVQRPAIAARMNADLRIMAVLARLAERLEVGRRLSLVAFVDDLHRTTNAELNTALEAHRQDSFRHHIGAFGDNRHITAPEVYWSHCGPRVLCMERLHGVPVDTFTELRRRGVDGELILRRGIKVALEAACVHGPFHGDVHAGNIWVLDDGRGAFLDFGLMGELPDEWKTVLADLFRTSMLDDDWSRVVRNYKRVGVLPDAVGDDEVVGAMLARALEPVLGSGASSMELGPLFTQQLELTKALGARVPQELMLLIKQIFYFERYIKELAPNYVMARDLFLIRNIWPAEVATRVAELGVELPDPPNR